MKKTLEIVLAIFMIISTIPMVMATDDPSTVITDEASLQTALDNGGEYTLGNDVIRTDSVYHSNDVTTVIDMNGYEIGDTTCTATLYDADNNVLATDSVVMTSRAGIIDKIVGFINYIFGCTVYYEY